MQIVSKQPKNLKHKITGLKKKNTSHLLEASNNPGCFKCNKCRVSCPILKETQRFSSKNTQRSYKIKHHLTCDSPFVIYLADCNRCKGQYVGKSVTPFKKRHSNHKQEIKHSRGGLGQHFGPKTNCNYEDLSITLIEQVRNGDRSN